MKIIRYVFIFAFVFFIIFNFKIKNNITKVVIKDAVINVNVADSDIERKNGLSGKKTIKEDEGLLFVFPKSQKYGFWMKDMNFPIDIAWINENKMIVHIENDVATSTYPNVFYPPFDSLYVLEVKSGFFVKKGIKIGDYINF